MSKKHRRDTRPDAHAVLPELEVLAITERFVADYHAGAHPRLADYIARYPLHAAALADFVAGFLSDAASTPAEVAEVAADDPTRARPLSPGTQRALDALFPPTHTREPASRLAESSNRYRKFLPGKSHKRPTKRQGESQSAGEGDEKGKQ